MHDDLAAKKRELAEDAQTDVPAESTARLVAAPSREHAKTLRTARPDAEIVRAVAAGDRGALAELYDRHAGLLLPLAQRILRSRDEAEDLLHDVFVEVWRKAADYDEERGSVRSWLVLRMRSRALDRLKSPAFAKVSHEPLADVAGPPPDHEMASVARIAKTAMEQLPHEQQRVLDMLYFQGLTLAEIATMVEEPIGTLKSRLARALRTLRVAMAEQDSVPT